MPELPDLSAGRGSHPLDSAASDARSLLRRATRLAERLAELEDPRPGRLGEELVGTAQRLLEELEAGRAQERLRLRRTLLGESDPGDD